MRNVHAVVPIKETREAKNRLASVFSANQRRQLALAMAADVLSVLAKVRELAGILVVTTDPKVALLATQYGATVSDERASDGHTEVVNACARRLAHARSTMLALPSDIPLVKVQDIQRILSAGRESPSFVIVPAHDERGSNAILSAPADAVPLRFGENSFFPHLAAARACGIVPVVLNCSSIALDIDTPVDVARFMSIPSRTRSRALLEDWGTCRQPAVMRQESKHDT